MASRAQDSRGAPSPGTGEEGVLRSHVASSALITAVGTVRDKVKVEDTGAQGKQGLSPQSQAQSPHTKRETEPYGVTCTASVTLKKRSDLVRHSQASVAIVECTLNSISK